MFGNMPFNPGMGWRDNTCMSVPLFRTGRFAKHDGCPSCGPDFWPRHSFEKQDCCMHRRPDPCCLPKPCCRPDPCCVCQQVPVKLVNPCDPCDTATVLLGVDECGNLQVCIRRHCP